MSHVATHQLSITDILFEYVELFARNPDLNGAQLARREMLRHALVKETRVAPEQLNAALVPAMLAACEVEQAKERGSAPVILDAKGQLMLEIQHIEEKCFTTCNL